MTVYDNPVCTVTLTKLIDGGGEGTFNFKVTVFNSDGTTRLAGYTIGEKGGNALTTNKIGEVTLPMGDQESGALNIPHGSKNTVEETQNSRYLASYTWNGSEAVESNVFGSDPVGDYAAGNALGNDNTDNTLFVLPVGNYMLTETTEPQNYISLEEGIGIIVGPDGITVGNNENASITGPDSEGVYTLTVIGISRKN